MGTHFVSLVQMDNAKTWTLLNVEMDIPFFSPCRCDVDLIFGSMSGFDKTFCWFGNSVFIFENYLQQLFFGTLLY